MIPSKEDAGIWHDFIRKSPHTDSSQLQKKKNAAASGLGQLLKQFCETRHSPQTKLNVISFHIIQRKVWVDTVTVCPPKWSFWTDFGQNLANLRNVDWPGFSQIWASLAAIELKPVQETEVMNSPESLNDGNSVFQKQKYKYIPFLQSVYLQLNPNLLFLQYFLIMITACPSSFVLRPLSTSWQSTSTIISRLRTHWQTKCCDHVCCQMLQIRPVPRWTSTDGAMMAVRR